MPAPLLRASPVSLPCRSPASLEDDGQRASGKTLAALARQYQDSDGFGASALRAKAEKFFQLPTFAPSEVHAMLASLPFALILTTCPDALLTRRLTDATEPDCLGEDAATADRCRVLQ